MPCTIRSHDSCSINQQHSVAMACLTRRWFARLFWEAWPRHLFLLYAILETLAFLRWSRERARIDASARSQMSPSFDRERWARFFSREMRAQRRPREILQRVFQTSIRNISRERALHFLCCRPSAMFRQRRPGLHERPLKTTLYMARNVTYLTGW